MAEDPGMSTSAQRARVGAELRRLREALGHSSPAVAQALGEGWSQSKISRIENAKIAVSIRDLASLLAHYGAPEDVKAELLATTAADLGLDGSWLVRAGGTPRRQGEVAAIETRLKRLRQYQPLLVPGQLQAPQYTAAVARMGGFDDPDGIVERRRQRQQLLGHATAPAYQAVVDERSLLFRVGGPEVMRQQLEFLAERAALPNIEVRLIPYDRVRSTLAMVPFLIYEFLADSAPPVVMVETQAADLYLGAEDDVTQYAALHSRMLDEALDPAASIDYISSLARTITA